MSLSLEALIAQSGVRNIDIECSAEDILAFGDLCDPWKQVGLFLGLTNTQLNAIDGDNRTVSLKRLGTLQTWKEKFAFRATYKVLINALLKCGKADKALQVCQILAQKELERERSQSTEGAGAVTTPTAQLSMQTTVVQQSPSQMPLTSKLDLVIDAENRSSKHLGQIADSMHEWQGPIADHLELTPADVAGIKTKHSTELKLQAREALQIWKQRKGSAATYSNLIGVFEKAGYQGYADTVRSIVLGQTDASEATLASIVSPTSQANQPKSGSSPSAEQATSRNVGSSGNSITLAHLKVIKWKDDQGETQRFHLIDKIREHWKDIGDLLGISLEEQDTLSAQQKYDNAKCCRAVLDRWIRAPPNDYPLTGKGLIELLKDAQLDDVVSELKTVLCKANLM